MSARFEKITSCPDAIIPIRKTANSAGYDFYVSQDIIIPPHLTELGKFKEKDFVISKTLNEMTKFTKEKGIKPTLVPTGIKAKLDSDTYLELSVRSSCPLKHWLILANGVGIIDADYYNNADNEGHIYFQIINLSPFSIILKKGDCIGQGIIKPYLKTEDDQAAGTRDGGFGSTDGAQTSRS